MKFDKQVEKAKKEQLKYRITRDIIFIGLGIIFLCISIFSSLKESKEINKNNDNKKITVTTKK